MVTLVFGGPSLQGVDCGRKDMVVMPPASQGELLRYVRELRPKAVGLLDCELPYRDLPTWHKEILYVLSRGIPVVGASGVGAHRAAELQAHGMEGVGSIFRRVASGELERDDEVMGDWEGTSGGMRILSVPLVTMRDGIAAARQENVLSGKEATLLSALAEGLFWRYRTWEALLEAARAGGMGEEPLGRFEAWLPQAPDPVREDAEALLNRLEELGNREAESPGDEAGGEEKNSALFASLDYRDRPLALEKGKLRQWHLGDMVSFSHPEAEDCNGRALNRRLVLLLGTLWDITPSKEVLEVERKRLFRRFGLKTEEEIQEWMKKNDLTPEELYRLLKEEAVIHSLHRWFMQGRIHEKNTGALLDEMKLRGGYEEWKRKAARRQSLLEENEELWREEVQEAGKTPFARLLKDHLRAEGFPWKATLAEALPEMGMEAQDLLDEMIAARVVRRSLCSVMEGMDTAPKEAGE